MCLSILLGHRVHAAICADDDTGSLGRHGPGVSGDTTTAAHQQVDVMFYHITVRISASSLFAQLHMGF